MKAPSARAALSELPAILAELLDLPLSALKMEETVEATGASRANALVRTPDQSFAVEYKSSSKTAAVAKGIEQVRRAGAETGAVPLLLVPFLGGAARRRCRESEVGCLDLSGNAEITAPGLRIMVEGRPNRFKRPGRPSSVFATKSSRLIRWLLLHPAEAFTQADLAEVTGLDKGHVSRLTGRLLEDGLVNRNEEHELVVPDPLLLLDAWREQYDFGKLHVVKGHIPARSGEALMHQVSEALSEKARQYAVTGLAAAWLHTRFAGFRTVLLYATTSPANILAPLGFREGEPGANMWILTPEDEWVFKGATIIDGVRSVGLVQTYLDLKSGLEHSEEAAEQVKNQYAQAVDRARG
ncbi:MAG: hypothetical protein Kow00129_08000 [Thermoleophilia bacterium]